eukprot:1182268-Prorocentrum_minimum.AAC.3
MYAPKPNVDIFRKGGSRALVPPSCPPDRRVGGPTIQRLSCPSLDQQEERNSSPGMPLACHPYASYKSAYGRLYLEQIYTVDECILAVISTGGPCDVITNRVFLAFVSVHGTDILDLAKPACADSTSSTLDVITVSSCMFGSQSFPVRRTTLHA